ncbi:hypothetical protein [Nonomuraea insulae]|uniref:Tetratricopeptide repeat protein n=1 Tax=Nonomuraea insulae TaxID=1616787 RepID=A0ABW1D7H7_9ACTN
MVYLGDMHAAAGDEAAAHDTLHRALDILDRLGHPDAGRLSP